MTVSTRRYVPTPFTVLFGAIISVAACASEGGTQPSARSGSPATGAGSPPAAGSPAGAGPGVADPAAPGTAEMVVEGKTLSFPSHSTCNLSVEGEFNFNFIAADGLSDIRAGGFRADEMGWMGAINVFYQEGQAYTAQLAAEGVTLSIEGKSLLFVGPIDFQPRNDGSLPTARPAGEGTIRATCP
jgi:hypothetical protein